MNQYGVCLDALAKDYTPTVYPSEIRYGVGVGAVKIVFNRTDPNKPRLDVSDLWRGIVNGREEPVCRQHFYYLAGEIEQLQDRGIDIRFIEDILQ